MSRSTQGTLSVLAVLAMVAGIVVAPLGSSSAQAVDWTTVPGAAADDLIATPTDASFHNGEPGFSFTARANGFTDYCASLTTSSCADYHRFFSVTSATVDQDNHIATVSLTPSIGLMTTSGVLGITFETSPVEIWNPVFSSTSHGWFHTPQLANGTLTPREFVDKECAQGVLCTVQFYLTDDTNTPTGNKWLLTSFLGSGGQFVIPLTSTAPPASPPTAAFSASLSGTATHDWNFDGSASTADTGQAVTRFQWTFGDGTTSITAAPTTRHTYADGSPHTASLVVLDSAGASSASVTHTLTEPALIVNSTGDAPATDPSRGCDTGGTVGTPATPECTLRAAIQSLDAGVGGTKIAFALPAGSTTITTASPLPNITKAGATIDGTEASGMPTISGSSLHVKNASGVTLTKVSVIASGDLGVFFEDSAGATLTASSIGVSPSGTVSMPKFGVVASSSGVVTIGGAGAGNVIAGTVAGITIASSAPTTSLIIQENSIGERADGTLIPGLGQLGVVVFARSDVPIAGAIIGGNQIGGFTTNLSLAGAGLVSPLVTGNRIGVAADQDSLVGAARVNVRLDGVPGAIVSGNQIAGASYDVLVSGNVQVTVQDAGNGTANIGYHYPGGVGLDGPMSGPLLGTGDTISGNRIGTVTRQSRANVPVGVDVWNAADDTTISGNMVLNHDNTEIWVSGSGARLRVTGNTLGASSADSVSLYTGMKISGVPAPTVSQNAVGGVYTGIALDSDVTAPVVSGNTVGFGPNGASALPIGGVGISVGGPNAIVGPDNTVGNAAGQGISIGGANAQVFSNRVGVAKFGSTAAPNLEGITVSSHATGAVIGGPGKGNTIVGNGTGLKLRGTGADVGNNFFGLITSGPLGNGTSIDAGAAASIHDNTIANSTTQAVTVNKANVVALLHNSIYATTGNFSVSGAGDPPTVVAAARVVHGSSARTFLVLQNVPTATGTIEVFGNASCDDPEGRVPLFTTPTTQDAVRVISVADRTELAGLTVMVTTSAGTTRFSNCEGSTAQPDTDGDGIPDVVEAAYPAATGLERTTRSAAFVADNQQWVVLSANGTLSNVSPIDDPDPSGHPGATFPLGLIDWTVSGIEPGSFADVAFTLPGTVINGWWKYSPQHTPAFFDYAYSSITGYGAKVVAANLPIFGLSTNVVVRVPDGGVGDDDGLENGSVHDPSAPAVIAGAPTIIPLPTVAPIPTIAPTATQATALAHTGTTPSGGFASGALAVLAGLFLLGIRQLARRRTRTRP